MNDSQHRDGRNARKVVEWLGEKSYGDKPFFITVGIHKPHVPFIAPQKYFNPYPKNRLPFGLNPVAPVALLLTDSAVPWPSVYETVTL